MTDPASWELLRKRYKEEIFVVPKSAKKFHIYLAQYEALCMDALDDMTDHRVDEMASDALMMFTAVRVGHIAPKATKRPESHPCDGGHRDGPNQIARPYPSS